MIKAEAIQVTIEFCRRPGEGYFSRQTFMMLPGKKKEIDFSPDGYVRITDENSEQMDDREFMILEIA